MPQEVELHFNKFDPAAKADIIAIAATDQKPWSTINDLRYDNLQIPGNYATSEWNHDIDDGIIDEFPDAPSATATWGIWTASQSDIMHSFAGTPPSIKITFSADHKSPGIILHHYPHSDDYASSIRVTWYNAANAVIKTGIYANDSITAVIREDIAGYRSVLIDLLATNIRHRFVKIWAIDFGVVRIVFNNDVISARLLEEVDPTCGTISSNSLTVAIKTTDGIFSPITSQTPDDMMMTRQTLDTIVNKLPYGRHFLNPEGWEDPNQRGIDFILKATDAVSVLDQYPFTGGLYTNKLVSDLLNEIFAVAFPTMLVSYTLDTAYATSRVTGWIPYSTCGVAFHHVMFALHAIADTSRRGGIWIYPEDTAETYTIPLSEQYPKRGGKDMPTKYFSGVDVVSYRFVAGAEATEAQNGELLAGQHPIAFTEPLHTLSVSAGCTIVTAHVNYAIINVPTTRVVKLTGHRYVVNTLTHSARSPIPPGEIEKIDQYSNFTLVSPDIGLSLAQKILAYRQKRVRSDVVMRLLDREVGYVARLKTDGRDVIGTITQLDTNLRSGVTKAVIIGGV